MEIFQIDLEKIENKCINDPFFYAVVSHLVRLILSKQVEPVELFGGAVLAAKIAETLLEKKPLTN